MTSLLSIGSTCGPPTPLKAHSPPCDIEPYAQRDASQTGRRLPWSSSSHRPPRKAGAVSTGYKQLPKVVTGIKFIDGIEDLNQQPLAA
jgi:hypothetical protein